jgi:hypothetical protein
VLYRTEQLAFVQFRTVDWPGYKDFGNYARVALFSEHLRPADPQSPGVVNFVQAIATEAAAQHQQLSNCRRQANGQTAIGSVPNGIKPIEHRAVTKGSGVRPPVRQMAGGCRYFQQ